ncbi:lactate utilization protein [Chloroflexota bacterium]
MVDETDITQERQWLQEERAGMVVKNLQKRNVNGQYVPNREEALSAVMAMIPPGVVVARGDSVSFEQVGGISELKKRNQNKFIDPFDKNDDGTFTAELPERRQLQREVFFADIFLTGTNAITLDGKLVNIDGGGNRVAPMIFGPKKVIVVVGVNKIVRDVDEALKRINEIAAPMNAKRHYLKHHRPEFADLPCVRTGTCVDCTHDWRICRYTVIIEGTSIRDKGRINVVLVGEDLGL